MKGLDGEELSEEKKSGKTGSYDIQIDIIYSA
jgi:hypothetical protein